MESSTYRNVIQKSVQKNQKQIIFSGYFMADQLVIKKFQPIKSDDYSLN